MADSVKIKIGADTSEYKKGLESIGKATKAGMADIKAGIDLASAALQKFTDVAKKGIDYNAQLETLTTSFEVMTGSAEKAAEVVERLRVMGAETPYEALDLANTTQLLMQYGFTADEAIDRMSMLGDIAQGSAEKMNSVALGYAQMSSAGKVNLVDIKQMINAGFNPLQEISESTGESMASLYDRISKGTMSVDEITQAMVRATSEGGKFFGSMEKQSQTLNGQLSTLRDNADQLLGSLTEGLSEDLRAEILPIANDMIGELQQAYAKGGTEGLKAAALKMVHNLLGYLPTALRSASGAFPQIASAFFEVATLIVTDLVAMFPEWAPVLIGGIVDLIGSVLKGAESVIEGLFIGIEQAFHKGQKKIAGVWVDESNLAKYNFDIEVDVGDAESEIETAYQQIRDALKTDLLTEEQKNEIIGMIGSDYQSVKDKLLSFGLSEEEAAPIAEAIATAGNTLIEAYSGLNVGIDATTLARLTAQANGSRIVLKGLLKDIGLTDSDIAQVTAVYDEMMGKVGEATPSIIEEIYDKLTDGEPDDAQTVSTLKDKAAAYFDKLLDDLEEVYAARSNELDSTAADYQAQKEALDQWYTSTKASITGMSSDVSALVDELAGAPTAVVQARMNELAEMELIILGYEERIEAMAGKARTAAENAFNVVRSGANADEATISTAIKFKVEEFKLDEQSAEDAYAATVEQLNADLASGTITQEAYDKGMETAQADLEQQKAAAKAAFERAFGEIMQGIAESEGNAEALNQAMEAVGAKMAVEDFVADMFDDSGNVDQTKLAGVSEQLASVLGEAFSSETLQSYLTTGDALGMVDYLETMAGAVDAASAESLKTAIGGKVGEAWSSALESGVLTGTSFDTSNDEAQLAALFTATAQNAATAATPDVQAAGATLGTEATAAEASAAKSGSKSAGETIPSGTAVGISSKAYIAVEAARKMAQSVVSKIRQVFDSHSPSKVAIGIGNDFGDGMSIGLRESMERAVLTAKRLSGNIVTSADMSTAMRVNYSGLQQEIVLANEQASTPVYLDGKQIAQIQGHNNSVQLAWDNTRSSKGVGRR